MPVFASRIYLKSLLLIGVLLAFAYLAEISPLQALLDTRWIDAQVRDRGIPGELLFLGMAAAATALGVPRQAISFLAGYAFDVVLGTLFAVLATVAGCLLSFCFARWFGRRLVTQRFAARIRNINAFIHDHTLSMTLLIRLLPAGNNLLTNLAAGVSGVRATPFVLGSALGYIPQSMVFALIGSGVGVDPLLHIGLGVLLLLFSGALGTYLYRKYRQGRHLDARLEQALGVDD